MLKKILLVFIAVSSIINLSFAAQNNYRLVDYKPLTKYECLKYKKSLGIKYCRSKVDYLAGAALACGHIKNLPSKNDLQILAQEIYNTRTSDTTIYGDRDDEKLQEMGIFADDSHIYYWIGEEAKDRKGGYVRMFASKGSIPYYAPRDGSGYVSQTLGKVNFGDTKYVWTRNPEHNSNLSGLPNNDVLLAICKY